MKTLTLVAVLVAILLPSPAAAQSRDRTLYWTGLGLSVGGGVLSLVGGYGMRKTECELVVGSLNLYEACFNKPNYPVVFTGVGLATAGSVMMAIGARQSIAVGYRRVTYIRRF